MTAPLTQDTIRNAATNAAQKDNFEQLNDFLCEMIGAGAEQTLTIASDQVTPPARGACVYKIETQGAASTDDLRNMLLTNVSDGRIAIIRPTNSSHEVVVKHAVGTDGDFILADGVDFHMTNSNWRLYLQLVGTSWVELFRTYGSDYKAARDYLRIPYHTGPNLLAPHDRLRADWLSAATIQVQADAVVLTDSAGGQKRFASVNVTLNIATTGANGRLIGENSGAEKASDWYYGWLIGKDDGTIAIVGSLNCFPGGSSIYASLPSGYTYAGLVTAAYNNASSNLTDFWQRNNYFTTTSVSVLSLGAATTQSNVSLTAAVPDIASEVLMIAGMIPQSSGSSATATLFPDQATAIGGMTLQAQPGGSANTIIQVELCTRVPQAMAYSVAAGDTLDLTVRGFRL